MSSLGTMMEYPLTLDHLLVRAEINALHLAPLAHVPEMQAMTILARQ